LTSGILIKPGLVLSLLLLALSPILAQQGIKGKVEWREGNLMPGPDQQEIQGKGIRRTLWIYPVITTGQATQDGVFFSNITALPMKKVRSNRHGKFCVKLPAGMYSVLVEEDDGLFANRFNQHGQINPIEVIKGKFTELTIVVDYRAAY
jgi:hypothetical protein